MNVVIQSPKLIIKRDSCYKNKLFVSNNSRANAHQVIGIRRGKTYYILLFISLFLISVSKTTRELLLHWSRVSYIYIFYVKMLNVHLSSFWC
jgi:hypothetical protein